MTLPGVDSVLSLETVDDEDPCISTESKDGILVPGILHKTQADGFAMSRKLLLLFGSAAVILAASTSATAAERFTFKKTNDPRPDILPHPIYDAHVEYRRAYNRPRYVLGWIASKVAPSSQEAMSWHDNLQSGRYNKHHMPPLYKKYFYPKPWEVLATGARPDTKVEDDGVRSLMSQGSESVELSGSRPALIDSPSVPEPIPNP